MAAYYHFDQYNDFNSVSDGIKSVPSASVITDNTHTSRYHSTHEGISLVTPDQALSTTHHLDRQNAINDGIVFPTYIDSHMYDSSLASQPGDIFSQAVDFESFQQQNDESCLQGNLLFNTNITSKGRQRKACRMSKSISDFQTSASDPQPCKSRKRSVPTPEIGNCVDRVFIWDLDETSIVFQSLLSGDYARRHGKDIQRCLNLGLEMEDFIFYLSDTYFFFRDLEENDQMHLSELYNEDCGQDLSNYDFLNDGLSTANTVGFSSTSFKGSTDWLMKITMRYNKIKEIYANTNNSIQSLLPGGRYERWLRLRCNIESFTDSWSSLSHQALALISNRNDCANILVTSTHLVPAFAKLMLFGLSSVFTVDNVYSAAKSGKELCFEKIARRYDHKTTFIVIGDGNEEENVAKSMNWPFWRIENHSDLIALNHALENDFM